MQGLLFLWRDSVPHPASFCKSLTKTFLILSPTRREKTRFHRHTHPRTNKNKIITTNKKRAGFNLLACFYSVPLAAEAFFLLAPKKNQKRADDYLLFLLLSPPGLPPLGRLGASSPSSSGTRPSISISASLLERLILP